MTWIGAGIALALLTVACGEPEGRSEATRSSPTSHWVEELKAEEPARWREAELWLAKLAPESFEALDRHLASAPPAWRQRVRDVLDLALLKVEGPPDLSGHLELWKLAAPEIEEARRLAAPLDVARVVDLGEPAHPPGGTTPGAQRLRALGDLGGFAVPAALDLCRSENPVARAYGIVLLGRLQASSAAWRIDELRADTARVRVQGADWTGERTVATLARDLCASQRSFAQRCGGPAEAPVADAIEDRILALLRQDGRADAGSALVNHLRTGGSRGAATWEQWWESARPAWRQWWNENSKGGSRSENLP